MSPDPRPPNSRDLEQMLARRPMPEPAADFRARVLAAVVRDRPAPVRPSRWRYVQWAAAVVLILNLAMSIANGVRFRDLASLPAHDLAATRRLPDDSGDRVDALAVDVLSHLSPAPDAGTLDRDFFRTKEDRRWAMP